MVAELPVSAEKQTALGLTEGMASAVLCAQVRGNRKYPTYLFL
jgi:hypothetical protein